MRSTSTTSRLLFLLLIFHVCIAIIVPTSQGDVEGIEDNGVNVFLGIPFAAPPTGSLRWTPPQPPSPWNTTLNATSMPPNCPQTGNSLFNLTYQSEDCLYLNVYVPLASPPPGGYPVMVWFFGGGFTYGGTTQYDGTFFAKFTDVILVIGNYRVGPLGFLAHTALQEGNLEGTTGNYGIMDQQMVLKWVQTQIGAFGGNPGSVTIFGESAGGISVCMHLLSPLSKGLFEKAILQSGPCLTTPSLDWGLNYGNQFASVVDCSSSNSSKIAQCMRSLSISEVLNALPLASCSIPPAVIWWPIRDGVVIPKEDTLTLLQQHQFAQVPILMGSNLNEGTVFIYPCFNETISEASYEQILDTGYGNWGSDLLRMYPFANYINGQAGLSDVVGDGFFTCQVVNFEEALVNAGVSELYSYIYTHTPSFVPAYYGALHGAEIILEFYNFGSIPITNGENQIAFFLMNSWTSFAKTGNPNYNNLLEPWSTFSQSGKRQVIDVEVSTSSIYKQTQCQLWAQVYQNSSY